MISCSRSSPNPGYSKLPTQAHIAFAFAIVRSKPSQVQLEDHIESLRTAIVTHPGVNGPGVLEFDPDMYWKACYQKAEAERLRLLNELSRLEQDSHSPRNQQEPQPVTRQAAARKRKGETLAQTTSKKAKPQQDPKPYKDGEIDLDFTLAEPTTEHQALVRGFSCLRRSLNLIEPDQIGIEDAIQIIAISFSAILHKDMRAMSQRDNQQAPQPINEICSVLKRIYPSILSALKYMKQKNTDENETCSLACTSMTRLFQAFLGRLHKLALDEVAQREQEARRNRRGSGFQTKEIYPHEEQLAHAHELVRTLIRMITSLDVSVDAHCELLEMFLCALLDHIGSSLSLLVFADKGELPQKRAEILPPSGILGTARPNVETSPGSVAIEGPYLILILRMSLDFLLKNTKQMSTRSLSMFTHQPDGGHEVSGNDLVGQLQETLQNTLMRGAFGDNDETFCNSLRRAQEEKDEIDLAKLTDGLKEKEGSAEWFIGELWEHLGWDILSGRKTIRLTF